ncbi:MAG: hypothetical protein ACREHC_01415 [Candidatus Levyibacteriota bacterium]
MFRTHYFKIGLLIFIALQLFYYASLMVSYQLLPFNKYLYGTGFHYAADTRVSQGNFNLVNALSAWDGQWYYRIAKAGYTTKSEVAAHRNHAFLDQYAYAFFPLYPYSIAFINTIINNIAVSAFILSNIFLIALFFTTYYVVSKLYTHQIAMRTNFLMLFFPLSLFYRAYYAESLFLLLLVWFSYALVKRKWVHITLSLALLYLTKVNGFFLIIPLLYVIITDLQKKKISLWKATVVLLLPFTSLLLLLYIGEINMGDPTVWITAHTFWGPKVPLIKNIQTNILAIYHFFSLPWHDYHVSKTEIIAFAIGLILLIKSKKALRPELWYVILSLSIAPLLIKSFTSYARYETVIFPFFIYFAMKIKGIWYESTVAIFVIFLLYFSTLFINWGWIN